MGGVDNIDAQIKGQPDYAGGFALAGAIAKAQLDTAAGAQSGDADFQIRSPEYASLHYYPFV